MVFMSIVEDKKESLGKRLTEFLEAIHGENTFEIRFIPEDKMLGKSISILKHENYLYANNSKGEKVKVCEFNSKNFTNYLDECLMFAGHTAVCFTVNSPNFNEMKSCITKNKHIINGGNINCQFVDIDAPKVIRHDKALLKTWKQTTKKRILSFALRPSIVVDTKNGFHVYWLLENGEHKLYKQIQIQLVQFFDGDTRCVNESRLLRLPYFLHRKDINEPYPITMKIFESKNKYTQEDFKAVLPELEEENLPKILESGNNFKPIDISDAKKEGVLDLLRNEIYTRIVSENEKKIKMHCIMPNHEDRNPSAFFNKESLWYYCSGCGSSFSLGQLAEELGWNHVVEVWNKYDIDIDSELNRIRSQMINVTDLSHLSLTKSEEEQVNRIANKVIEQLYNYNQCISEKHQQYIHDIVQVLCKANKEKPYLIPLDMGGGKSLIIETFLQEMIICNPNFGAIVCVQRIEDVKKKAQEINIVVGKEVAFPMYGFVEEECLLNKKGNSYSYCIAKKGKPCSLASKCRLFKQPQNQENYPIIVMTIKGLSLRSKSLDKYNYFLQDKQKINREMLIIDEKPEMIFVETLNFKNFETYSKRILEAIQERNFDGDLTVYNEFNNAVELIEPYFTFEAKGRTLVEPLIDDYYFSTDFWELFNSIYDYTNNEYKIPKILESVLKNGGHIEAVNEDKISITTSSYQSYSKFNEFQTIVFDGTGDIDLEYQHKKFHVLNFEPIRTYEGLTINKCDFISGTKTGMQNEEKIRAFCEEVKKIAEENPDEKIFVPVFKDNESDVREHLKKYIDSERIKIAHFGSTRGSNNYKDCNIVIIGGILHKTENYYIGKSLALYKQRGIELEDIGCSNFDKVRRFDDTQIEIIKILDMLVDYSQEIKRSNQRDNSKNIKGEVYIFHNDKILLDIIGLKFPKCNFIEWIPEKMVKEQVFSRNNNKNVQAIYDYIENNSNKEVITFKEMREAVGIKKTQLSDILRKNQSILTLIKLKGYVVEKCNHDKREKQLVKS